MSDVPDDDAQPPFFHLESGALRFWVDVGGSARVGASISKQTLHYRFKGDPSGSDAVAVYQDHRAQIDAAVRRRIESGSIEPVMLREADLRQRLERLAVGRQRLAAVTRHDQAPVGAGNGLDGDARRRGLDRAEDRRERDVGRIAAGADAHEAHRDRGAGRSNRYQRSPR
jgi:hypothetical protein